MCVQVYEKDMYTNIYHMHVLPVNIIEANAMILPGRVPGYKRSDIQLLPSSTTKHKVWELYQQISGNEASVLLHFYLPLAAAPSSCGSDEAHE